METHYSSVVEWSEEDEEFVALSPEFPGASGSGDSPQAALQQLQESLSLLVATYEEKGLPLPVPQQMESYSGQVRLRIPREMHREAAMAAERQGVSLNTLFVSYIAQGLGRQERHTEMIALMRELAANQQALLLKQPVLDAGGAPSQQLFSDPRQSPFVVSQASNLTLKH